MQQNKLFSVASQKKEWTTFRAAGYKSKVAGVVYGSGGADCGLALGGIATGHIDLNTDGTLGRCTCFNSIIPPRELGNNAFLALEVDGKVWGLSTQEIAGVKSAKDVQYWGHYPVADLQFQTSSPVKASLRAWSPFIPGDAEDSNTPAIVFEVRLHNSSKKRQRGTLGITLPGATADEAGGDSAKRRKINRKGITGTQVDTAGGTGYAVLVDGVAADKVKFGGALTAENGGFANLGDGLPAVKAGDNGVSAAVEFDLKAGQGCVVRFVYSWYYPLLHSGPHSYEHAYAAWFDNAVEVAEDVVANHEALLGRIIAWQEVIYQEESLPVWLRDCLVNSLYLMAEDAFWATNSIPPEPWAEETGMFSMVESTRTCPGQACIPSDFYGNFPVLYFFPELALSTCRGFAAMQRASGEIPIYWGQNYDRQTPTYQLLHVTSPCNYVDLVDRLWHRSGDEAIVHEFYGSVKKAVRYLQSLDADGDGLLDCQPGINCTHQFYGSWAWQGAAVHVEGMWLSVLLMARRMAEITGDTAFAKDCDVWFNLGQHSMEEKLWTGSYYRLYNDTTNKAKSDTILSNQLCGQWCAKLHATEDVFPAHRISKVFQTVKQKCGPAAKWGIAGAVKPNGKIDRSGGETSEGTFVPENMIVAMTMLYSGDKAGGMKIAREAMHNLVLEQGLQWDMPNTIVTETGEWLHGNDFDQLMIVWSLPAAIWNQNLSEAVSEGSFVDKILMAGNMC